MTLNNKNPNRNKRSDNISLVYGKVPPQQTKAEDAVLGAMLLEKSAIDLVVPILPTAEYFYKDSSQKIYNTILELNRTGGVVDIITVTAHLGKKGEIEIIGGAYYLSVLLEGVVSSAHIEQHSYLIKEAYLQREIIRVGGQSVQHAYDGETDPLMLLEHMQDELFQLTMSNVRKEVSHVSAALKLFATEDDRKSKSSNDFYGVPTGNNEMDRCTGGWKKGAVIIIAARPAVGKTAFALSTAANASINHNIPVVFFSLEMPMLEIVERVLAADSNVDIRKIQYPKERTPDENRLVIESLNRIGQAPLFLDDTAGLTSNELRAKARRLKQKHDIQVIIIDYLQLMKGDTGDSRFRAQEIGKISRELKELAKELEVAIIPLAQLNRSVESRSVRKYLLSDLKESGDIEQDADIVGFLHVPGADDLKNADKSLHVAGVFIEKHRGGKCEKIPYYFNKSIQKWSQYGDNSFTFSDAQGNNRTFKQVNNQPETKDDLPF